VWPLVSIALFLLVESYMWQFFVLDVDSGWYAQLAYQLLGEAPHTAHLLAEQVWCAKNQPPSCMADYAAHFAPTDDPRYVAIFNTRPGYPLMIAGLFSVIGHMRFTLWIIPVICTALAGLGVYWLLRLLGLVPALAAAGQVLLYVLPTGTWGVHALTEGPITAGAVAVVLGGVLLASGRFGWGTVLLVVGLGSITVIKYSTGLPLAGLVVLAVIICWWHREADRRGLAVLGGIALLTVPIVLYVSSRFALPGFSDTAQDLFTNHFAKPDVSNVMQAMLGANGSYWSQFLTIDSNNLFLLSGLVVGLVSLFRHQRVAATLVLATVLAGFVLASAHPDALAGDRLYLLAWLGPVIAFPVFAHRAIGPRGTADEVKKESPAELGEGETQQFSLTKP
jgi:4-amino-4-deoxy-L-arabinose transferase-like glycosyltransferase